jgi:uncharacterized protein (TIGR03435 family)
MDSAVANHLWQSTLFAAGVGLLTLACRANQASVRCWLWFSASVKFLVPFSILMGLGSQLEWASAAQRMAPAPVTSAIVELGAPFAVQGMPAAPAAFLSRGPFDPRFLLFAVWASGLLAVISVRWHLWRQIRTAVRHSVPFEFSIAEKPAGLQIRAAPGLIEPGVVGFWRPILLIPAGIENHLSAAQLEAVVAHELCHVRRHDNLTAAIHMIVEAVFWFHPLVWWIGARLVDERERACDEDVLWRGGDPQVYAEGILQVCKRYIETPLVCVSSVSGANLRRRVEAIIVGHVGVALSRRRKFVITAAAMVALVAPLVVGAMSPDPQRAVRDQVPGLPQGLAGLVESPTTGPDAPRFETASIRPNRSGGGGQGGGQILATGQVRTTNASLRFLIRMAYGLRMTDMVVDGPDWMEPAGFDGDPRPEEPVTVQRARLMLRTLLAERFRLVVRREPRELPVYALRLARDDGRLGPQIRRPVGECVMAIPAFAQATGRDDAKPPEAVSLESQPPLGQPGRRCGMAREAPGTVYAGSTAISGLITLLSPALDRPVVDKTGLTGTFDFDLRYTGGATFVGLAGRGAPVSAPDIAADPSSDAPSIFTALREQLGLKLEADRGPVDVLVVHQAERPTEN